MKITGPCKENEESNTLTISLNLHLDIMEGEDPKEVAEQALEAFQNQLEYGTICGRGDWVTAGENFGNLRSPSISD